MMSRYIVILSVITTIIGPGWSFCVLDNKRGWWLDCGIRDTYLFRLANFGGIKAKFDVGLGIGDEDGFPYSIDNTEGSHRRQIGDENSLQAIIPQDGGGFEEEQAEGGGGGGGGGSYQQLQHYPNIQLNTQPQRQQQQQDQYQQVYLPPQPQPQPQYQYQHPQQLQQWGYRSRSNVPVASSRQSPARPLQPFRFRRPPPRSGSSPLVHRRRRPVQHSHRRPLVGVDGKPLIDIDGRPITIRGGQGPIIIRTVTEAPDLAVAPTQPTIGPSIAELLQVAPETLADTDNVPSFAAKLFIIREAPEEYFPPGYEVPQYFPHIQRKVEIPRTKFYCEEQKYLPGIYADVQLGCKVFHLCIPASMGSSLKSYLCPNSTLFDQSILQCNWWYNVDCETSVKHYDANLAVALSYRKINAAHMTLDGALNLGSLALLSQNEDDMAGGISENIASRRIGRIDDTNLPMDTDKFSNNRPIATNRVGYIEDGDVSDAIISPEEIIVTQVEEEDSK